MLKLEIIPSQLNQKQLIDTATFLMKLAGIDLCPKPQIEPVPVTTDRPIYSAKPVESLPAFKAGETLSVSSAEIELDTAGKPWDASLHSRTRSKNMDGTWKLQRGLDKKAAPIIQEAIPEVVPQIAPPPPPSETIDWTNLMMMITSLVQEGKLTQKIVADIVQGVGVPSLAVLPTQPHLIPEVWKQIKRLST